MLCEAVRGNVFEDDARFAGKARDHVELSWRDCARRAVRARSKAGTTLGILLPLGQVVRHGDVVYEDGHTIVVVNVKPCEVIVAEFTDAVRLANAALELGNLHVPVEASGPLQLITLPDGPAAGVVHRYATSSTRGVRRFMPLRATVLGNDARLSDDFRIFRSA